MEHILMEDLLDFSRGFTCVPNAWLDLDLPPGALSMLLELCRLADDNGTSYASYKEIGRRIGRKQGSVCAYRAILEEHGLLAKENQTMANGWNYRLRLTLVHWPAFLAWRKQAARKAANRANSPVQKNERSIQQTERPDPKGHKTNIYQTNTTPSPFVANAVSAISKTIPVSEWSMKNEAEWHEFRPNRSAPHFDHGPLPSPEVVQQLRARVAYLEAKTGLLDPKSLAEAIDVQTQRFSRHHRLTTSADRNAAFQAAVAEKCRSAQEVDAFFNALHAQWKPNWRHLSLPAQVHETYDEAKIHGARPRGSDAMELAEQRGRLIDLDGIKLRLDRLQARRSAAPPIAA